jgi:23S rRNA pseudouridine955/2504/2580 synthase
MSDVKYKTISQEEDGQRLDNYLMRVLKGVPKSHIYRIIRSGEVRVNKGRAKPSTKIAVGDSIRIPPMRMTERGQVNVSESLSERLQKSFLFEDTRLMVINKPAGIAVHGGSGLSLGVIEAIRASRPDIPYIELAHRLDKETSGCLVLAKKRSVLRAIQADLSDKKVYKRYWALLDAPWKGKNKVEVDTPLEKNILKSGERMVAANESGKPSQTVFKLLENFDDACLVEASPKTGRTHQIRVHAAYLGYPIIGDEKYGGTIPDSIKMKRKHRLYLHARSIQFNLGDEPFKIEAELDEQFTQTLDQLRLRSETSHE